MKFKFPFETLLRFRGHQKDAAQSEYMLAQGAVDECLRSINFMYIEIDGARERVLKLQNQGGLIAPHIQAQEEFIQGRVVEIDKARLKAKELMAVAEEKKEILIEAAKEERILQKVKERKKQKYFIEKRKKETKELDEINTLRFGRG